MSAAIIDGEARFGLRLAAFYGRREIAAALFRRGISSVPLLTEIAGEAEPAQAYVNPDLAGQARWIARCPDCERAGLTRAEYVWLRQPLLFCMECGNAELGRRWRRVEVPAARVEIERLLLARPDPRTRAWVPGETLALLVAENEMLLGKGG